MRAIAVACPHCGASLRVAADATDLTCQYCGKPAQIQRRSRILQVPRPVPTAPDAPLRVARQRVSPLAFLPFLIFPVALGLGAYSAFRVRSRVRQVQATQAASEVERKRHAWWGNEVPLVADVDGDGVGDPVGLVRYVFDGDRVHLAAYAGATGARLWESEALGTFSDVSQALVALHGDHVLLSTSDGHLRAFDRRTGAAAWTVAIGEKLDALCRADDPTVTLAIAADQHWWAIDAAGGKQATKPRLRFERATDFRDDAVRRFLALGAEGAPDLCLRVDNHTWYGPVGVVSLDDWSSLPTVPGMSVRRLVRRPAGPVIAVGYKSPGTSVPMLARVDGKRALWSLEVPAADPLNTRADDKHVALSATAAFIAYQRSSAPFHVTGFALADGARLWDVEVPVPEHGIAGLDGLATTDGLVLVATDNSLLALDAATGATRYRVGK